MTGIVIAVVLLATFFYLLLRRRPPSPGLLFWSDLQVIESDLVPPNTIYLVPGWLGKDFLRHDYDDSLWKREREQWWADLPLRPEEVAKIVVTNPNI